MFPAPIASPGARRSSGHGERPLARSRKDSRQESRRQGGKDPNPASRSRSQPPGPLATALLFALLGLVLYSPVLDGDFVSDDSHYVLRNEYVHDLTLDNLVAVWSPTSEVTVLVENYAPVHLMLHSLEWQVFGPEVTGYHVVNVLLHAVAAALLVPLYRRSGIGAWAALGGAAFFFVHPANVESVAWISQLKSSSALVLSLLAIRLHPSHPLAALLLFALALFAKPFAAFALPVVALFGWLRRGDRAERGAPRASFHWAWLGGWVAVVGSFALAESAAFGQSAGLAPPLYGDLAARYMTIFKVALRYVLMAVTGTGLSTFHEPLPVTSLADPWLVAGAAVVALLGWRTIASLRRGSEEAVWWMWAAIGFAPLSGVLPLPYPMADRYLYFVLPGLIGGTCLAWRDTVAPFLARTLDARQRDLSKRVVAGLLVAWLGWLGWQTFDRAPVYRTADSLMADAARHYPDGVAAHTRNAGRAAAAGNVRGAIEHLRAARARGYNRVDHLLADPRYASLRQDPDFVALQHDMADDWISRLEEDPDLPHYKARALAQAYVAKGDLAGALRVIERAAARPGPISDGLLADAEQLRRQLRLEERLEAERRRARSNGGR